MRFILDYYEDFSALPTASIIEAEVGEHFEIVEDVSEAECEYAIREVEKFCKNEAMRMAITESIDLMGSEDFAAIEELIRDAVMTSVNKDLGMAYYEDTEARLARLLVQRDVLPTCWPAFNEKMSGGPSRKELLLLAAVSGGGKSISMSNLALGYSDDGYNVLYLSLELDRDVISQRFDAMITGIGRRDWESRVPEIVAGVLRHKTETTGRMDIEYMPTETKAIEIRAFLKEYELKYGLLPDVICVDYLDKMAPNKRVDGNSFDVDKKISEQLRQIGVDHNALIISASQLNRSAVDEENQSHAHIAGGISKINECDTFITIYQNTMMKAAGELTFNFLKTRNSDAVGSQLEMNWDNARLKITDKGMDDNELLRTGGRNKKKRTFLEENEDKLKGSQSLLEMFD